MTCRIRISTIGGRITKPLLVADFEGSQMDVERLRKFLHGTPVMKVDRITPTEMTWDVQAAERSPATWTPLEFDEAGDVVR